VPSEKKRGRRKHAHMTAAHPPLQSRKQQRSANTTMDMIAQVQRVGG
jgi:hypothetical protein